MTLEQQAAQAAAKLRERSGLGIAPLGDIIAVAESNLGVDVAIVDSPHDEHGLISSDPEYPEKFILVSRSDNPFRQRFTIAHEIGHLVFEDSEHAVRQPVNRGREDSEIRADAFARHFLCPIDAIRARVDRSSPFDADALSRLVQYFLISPPIALIQARDAGFITSNEERALKATHTGASLAREFGWEHQYALLSQASNSFRPPQLLLAAAIRGYREGVISAQQLAMLSGESVEVIRANYEISPSTEVAEAPTRTQFSGLSQAELDLILSET